MLPRLTALLALALGLLRIAALSLHPDKLIADAPFSLADEVEYDARSIDLRSAAEKFERTHDRAGVMGAGSAAADGHCDEAWVATALRSRTTPLCNTKNSSLASPSRTTSSPAPSATRRALLARLRSAASPSSPNAGSRARRAASSFTAPSW